MSLAHRATEPNIHRTRPGLRAGQAARRAAGLAALATLALLAACGSTPPAPTAAPTPAAAPATAPAPGPARSISPAPPESELQAFVQQQRGAAELAARQGRWADALWAWDAVLAVLPDDSAARAQRAQAEAAAQAAVADRLPRARQAQQRGDADAATRLWLEILALDGQQAEAADALRTLERNRARRAMPAARAARAPMATPPDTSAPAVATTNALEHASLLANQGELDAAISLLQPLAGARGGDARLRALLADLYLRQADRLAPSDRPGAIQALERSLQLQPGHAGATARLRQLKAPATPPAAR